MLQPLCALAPDGASSGDFSDDDSSEGSPARGDPSAGRRAGHSDPFEALREEPTNEEELASKFQLFEVYSGNVQRIRASMMELWESTKPHLQPAAVTALHRRICHVDREQNMGVFNESRNWVVYDMAKQADSNCSTIRDCMKALQTALDVIASQEDCPVCLEKLGSQAPPHMLTCCHSLCRECWEHWSEVCRPVPFCPLCRNQEFIDVLARARSSA